MNPLLEAIIQSELESVIEKCDKQLSEKLMGGTSSDPLGKRLNQLEEQLKTMGAGVFDEPTPTDEFTTFEQASTEEQLYTLLGMAVYREQDDMADLIQAVIRGIK